MVLKCWKKWDNNRYHNERADKTLILQEGTNKMFIQDWKKGKRTESPSAPTRKKIENFAKEYMKKHDKC